VTFCYALEFFFFFQAEDGIRDFHVTGVQTCALPISVSGSPSPRSTRRRAVSSNPSRSASRVAARPWVTSTRNVWSTSPLCTTKRSEERRVGKEGRSRGRPYERTQTAWTHRASRAVVA